MSAYPITETMKGLLNNPAQLSTLGGVPGKITVPVADFGTTNLFGSSFPGTTSARFDVRDIPNIKDFGIYASIADGLAPVGNDTPGIAGHSLNYYVQWTAWIADTPLPAPLVDIALNTQVLNAQFPYSFFQAFQDAMPSLEAAIQAGADNTRISIVVAEDFIFDAYSMAAAWNNSYLALFAQATIEHTFPLIA